VADASAIGRLARVIEGFVPVEVSDLLKRQIKSAVQSEKDRGGSVANASIWFLVMLWSANRGTKGIVAALNVIYDRAEERGFLQRTALTLLLTTGSLLLLVLVVPAIVLLPSILSTFDSTGLPPLAVRWPVLFVLAAAALAVLYRLGPSRREPDWRWILLGSLIGAVLWIGFSLLLSWYIQTFASFTRIYGTLGTVVAFMIWLWLSALAALLGAELDATMSMADTDAEQLAETAGNR
jgi:membrane protein